jgi:hypothetical protein
MPFPPFFQNYTDANIHPLYLTGGDCAERDPRKPE